MKKINLTMLLITAFFLFSGCRTVNETMDKASEATREVSKPVGKVMNLPTAVAEGAAEGMQEKESNPFNR